MLTMGLCCSCRGQPGEPKDPPFRTPEKNKTTWINTNEGPDENLFKTRKPVPVEKIQIINKDRFAIPRGSINVKLPDDESDCLVTGSAILPNGDIFIVDRNNKKLKLFAYRFHYKANMALSFTPESACGVPKHSNVFVTFPELCKIWQIAIGDGIPIMKKINVIETQGRCTAICSNRFGGLAVAVKGSDSRWQVHLINDRGEIMKHIHGGAMFINPEHIAVTWDLNIIVSDKGNNIMYHITPEGQIIFVYKEIRAPLDTFTDKKDNIFLTGADALHQIDDTGCRVKTVLSRADIGFAPICMAYRETAVDELLVFAGRFDKIKVYVVLDKVTEKWTKKKDPWEKFRD